MQREFRGVIWTDHAIQRLQERNISQGDAWATLNKPDQSRYAKSKDAWVYYKTYPLRGSVQAQKIEVVAAQNERKQWVVLSVWSRPVYEAHGRVYKKEKKSKDNMGIRILKRILGVS